MYAAARRHWPDIISCSAGSLDTDIELSLRMRTLMNFEIGRVTKTSDYLFDSDLGSVHAAYCNSKIAYVVRCRVIYLRQLQSASAPDELLQLHLPNRPHICQITLSASLLAVTTSTGYVLVFVKKTFYSQGSAS